MPNLRVGSIVGLRFLFPGTAGSAGREAATRNHEALRKRSLKDWELR